MSEQEFSETNIVQAPPAANKEGSHGNQGDKEALETAQKHVRLAWIFATISASLTTAFAFAGFIFIDVTGPLAFFVDPWGLFDAALIWILVYFLRKQSFKASLFMVGYWVLSMFAIHLETGTSGGIIIRLYFLYIFVNGARGAYTLHKLEPRNPSKRGWRIVGWITASLAALLIIILVALSALIEQGFMPSGEIENSSSLPDRIVQRLRDEGVITRSENIDLFYSASLLDVMADGNLITNERVISYWINETEELEVASASFGDISEANITAKGDELTDTILTITQADGAQFHLVLPVAGNGDNRFYRRVNQLINR